MQESILLVDDDGTLLAELERGLHKEFRIVPAHSAEEALAVVAAANAQRQPFAIVIADAPIPGMGGIDVLARIKALSPDTMRIMLTSDASRQTAIDAINVSNVFHFFCKPCPTDELVEGILSAIVQFRQVRAEHEFLESQGYRRAGDGAAHLAALFAGSAMEGVEAPPSHGPAGPSTTTPGAHATTSVDAQQDIQEIVGYDIVNHQRLLMLADTAWRSVPSNKRAAFTVADWQSAVYEKCRDALAKAEKKLAEANPDPRILKANVNILHGAFRRQVIRAMQELSEHYRAYQSKNRR